MPQLHRLSVTADPVSGTISKYEWYSNTTNTHTGGTLAATHTSTSTTDSYTPSTATAGELYYYVVVTNSYNFTAASDASGKVTVNATPTAIAGGPNTVCQSASPTAITLSGASVGGSATTGAWSITSGGGALSSIAQTASPATVTFTPDVNYTGTVTLLLTSNYGTGCTAATAERTINVTQTSAATAGGPDNVCQSDAPSGITLGGASIGGGATTGAWSIISGGGTLSSTDQTATPATVTYTPAVNYTGTVTLRLTSNFGAGCSATTSDRTITVNALPTGTLSNNGPVCSGSNVLLTFTKTAGAGPFDLEINGTTYPNIASGGTISMAPSYPSTTYTLTSITDKGVTPNCPNTVSVSTTVTVNTLPTPSFTTQPGANACMGVDVTYTTQPGMTNYQWTFTGVKNTDYSITSGGTAGDNTVTLKWLTTGSKTVTVNYSANGCPAASPVSSTAATVNVKPVAPSAATTQSFCPGATVADLTTTSGININWYSGSTGGNPLSSTDVLANGFYYASQTVSECESSVRTQVLVQINTLPTITLGPNPSVCQGVGSVNLTYTGTTGGASQYRIVYGTDAIAADFINVTYQGLAPSPIVLSVPTAASAHLPER